MNFRPVLPEAHFDPEVRSLFGHQKLWDTLAEWEAGGRFPRDPDDPDRALKDVLGRATDEAAAYFNARGSVDRVGAQRIQ